MSAAIRPDTIQPYRFQSLAAVPGLRHGITRREGPGLAGNMSFTRGPDRETVLATRARWCASIGVDPAGLTFARQVHGASVDHVTLAARGRGASGTIDHPDADALVTGEPNLPIATLAADCVPILLVDPERRVVAAAHAGWRGTATGVVEAAVTTLVERFGSRPASLLAGIGPSIGPCCYEVGEEVAAAVAERHGDETLRPGARPGHPYLDLWAANARALRASGVRPEHIERADLCTRCHADQFFSHRAEGPTRGLFAAIIALES